MKRFYSNAVILAVIAVGLGACGTRVNDREAGSPRIIARNGTADSGVMLGASQPPGSPSPGERGESQLSAVSGRTAGEVASTPSQLGKGGVGTSGTPSGGATVAGRSPVGGVAAREPGTGPTAAGPPRSGPGTNPGIPAPDGASPGAASSGSNSPIVIGHVGTLSGPIGSVEKHVLFGVQAWTKGINQRGGLNGHQVRLLVYDDGFDPARHRAQVQEAVERQKVIAFVGNTEGPTGGSGADYTTQKRVPVVGTDGATPWSYNSAMYFPQMTSGYAFYEAAVFSTGQQMAGRGKAKLATTVCAEAQPCADAEQAFRKYAAEAGLNYVSNSRASLAAPDYTADCLKARNAGAEIYWLGLDPSSIGRFAASCARQGYRPIFGTIGSIQTDLMAKDPNLDGMVAMSSVFPYFQTGTPATDEFQRVLTEAGVPKPGIAEATGWVAAKLFERAAAKMPEPPSSPAVLEGLWSISNESLGGLTHPLSFIRERPTEPRRCWFDMTIKNHAWVSPDGYKLHCK